MTKKELEKLIGEIQKKMQKAAADLNFEAAAELRDKMLELKKQLNDMGSNRNMMQKTEKIIYQMLTYFSAFVSSVLFHVLYFLLIKTSLLGSTADWQHCFPMCSPVGHLIVVLCGLAENRKNRTQAEA